MSHYGPKWQVISNLSLTPVWTRIREPSMKADTPIFEFVICNWGEGGETVYYGLQQVMRDFSTDHGYIFVHQMDNYESRKFVKNREKKILNYRLMIVYIYRVGIKFSRFLIFTREKYIFFKWKYDLSHVRSSPFSICHECRFRGFPLPFPPQGLLAPLSSQEPMIWSTRKMPEEEIENVERVHEYEPGGCTNTREGERMEWERSVKPEKLLTATMASSDFKKDPTKIYHHFHTSPRHPSAWSKTYNKYLVGIVISLRPPIVGLPCRAPIMIFAALSRCRICLQITTREMVIHCRYSSTIRTHPPSSTPALPFLLFPPSTAPLSLSPALIPDSLSPPSPLPSPFRVDYIILL